MNIMGNTFSGNVQEVVKDKSRHWIRIQAQGLNNYLTQFSKCPCCEIGKVAGSTQDDNFAERRQSHLVPGMQKMLNKCQLTLYHFTFKDYPMFLKSISKSHSSNDILEIIRNIFYQLSCLNHSYFSIELFIFEINIQHLGQYVD